MENNKLAKSTRVQNYGEILGMDFNTADYKLDNLIDFNLMQKTGMDTCCVCDEKILDPEEMTVEHKIRWENQNGITDAKLFMNLKHIGYAHDFCNLSERHNELGADVIGVHIPNDENHYVASIGIKGKSYTVGRYNSLFEARVAYDVAGHKQRGKAGIYNFKEYLSVYKVFLDKYACSNEDFMSIRRGPIKKIVGDVIEFLIKEKQYGKIEL